MQKPDQLAFSHMVQAIGEGDSKPYGASLETLPDPNLPRLDEPSGKPNDVDGEALQDTWFVWVLALWTMFQTINIYCQVWTCLSYTS